MTLATGWPVVHRSGVDGNTTEPPPRLVSAAHEFEGQMMKELLIPMTDPDDSGGSDASSGVLGEFASEALGKALSAQGGFGIAKQILAHFSDSGNQRESKSVTGNGHSNTVIGGTK